MAAAVITVGPARHQRTALGHRLVRAQRLPRLERHGLPPGGSGPDPHASCAMVRARRLVARATAGLPVGEAGRTLLGEGAPWFESWLEHPEHDDPFWAPTATARRAGAHRDPRAAAHRLAGPVPRTDARAVRATAQARRAGRGDHRVVDPRAHADQRRADRAARVAGAGSTRTWRATAARDRSPVRIHVNHDGWLDLEDWPPAMPEQVRYLQPGGRLGDAVPPDTAHRRRRSPTTPPTRRRPSAAGCCRRRAATATTPSWPSAPTC